MKSYPLAAILAAAVTAVAPAAAAGLQSVLTTPHVELRLDAGTGQYEILDRNAGTVWRSNPFDARFAEATLRTDAGARQVSLGACEVGAADARVRLTFDPVPQIPEVGIAILVTPADEGRALDFAWSVTGPATVERIRLLDHALWGTDAEEAQVAVPVREGMLIPAVRGHDFTQTFDTYAYEGCHMAMLGLIKNGSAALLTWDDPYVLPEVASRSGPDGAQVLATSLTFRETARSFRLTLLGKGDHVTVARAYREVARRRGWLVPWSEKLEGRPDRAKLFGTVNYKLWSTLDRRMNEDSTKELSIRVNWTFEEAAQVAEHLKRDLKLDNVLFLMGGWIHRGYDNQHPDILPAAPECGGDEAFADCARRVRDLGYVLGLHDNYQDIYRDSPSWDESLVMRRPDRSLAVGGSWAGGRAYLTCATKALELAKRPQNLRAVLELTKADAYFIDTTYAAGLQECFDPNHPLKRQDDLHWKQELSDYARGVFGIFGSECGREWAIPHSDFFEGLTGVSGAHYHNKELLQKVGGIPIPLFELLYHDCVAMYGKYGYDPAQAAAYVLQHALYGRTMHHHNVPPHLYWKSGAAADDRVQMRPLAPTVEIAGPRTLRLTWLWRVRQTPVSDWRVFVHFTDPGGNILFQNDHPPDTPTSQWQPGTVESGTFTVQVPANLAGPFDVRVGLFTAPSLSRARLVGTDDGERRVLVGRLQLDGDTATYVPATDIEELNVPDAGCFVQGDGGWTEGMHPYDRFVKNCYELLSPLNELTSQMPMANHKFLTADHAVQETTFGEGPGAVRVVVNFGLSAFPARSRFSADVLLPQFGVLIEAPTFAAFHALSWNGTRCNSPVLFTLRSLDGRPLDTSRRIRVFHGFGGHRLRLSSNRTVDVPREAVVELER